MKRLWLLYCCISAACALCSFVTFSMAASRGQIRVVGSSAVYPFAATVAERFSFHEDNRTPIIESIGTGGGFKVFCSGIGPEHPDIVTASRKMTEREASLCVSRGVQSVYEIILGFDGVVFALSHKIQNFSVTREQLFFALAEMVPIGGKLIKNPYVYWSDIDQKLPRIRIRILGPTPSSGTRDAIIDLIMRPTCQQIWEKTSLKMNCHQFRQDGAYVDIGANENMIIQKVDLIPGAVGIVSYSFLDQNQDRVQPLAIDGATPTPKTIQNQSYILSRPLYLYAKPDHEKFMPKLHEFLIEFTLPSVSGPSGYLGRRGLIPLKPHQHQEQHTHVTNKTHSLDLTQFTQKN
jgi:phosphate transport system substrate-binding protein